MKTFIALILSCTACFSQVDEYRAQLFVQSRIRALHTNHVPVFAFRNAIDSQMTNVLAEWETITNHIKPGITVDVWWRNRTADECQTNGCRVPPPLPGTVPADDFDFKAMHERWFKKTTPLGTNYIDPPGALVVVRSGYWRKATFTIPGVDKLREIFP